MRQGRLGLTFLLTATISLFAGDFGRASTISVRISGTVSADCSMIGEPVEAVMVNCASANGKLIAPAGSRAHGIVSAAEHSVQGKASFPGSVSIRLETIDTEKGAYHLSTNQYTREGRGRSNSPFPG